MTWRNKMAVDSLSMKCTQRELKTFKNEWNIWIHHYDPEYILVSVKFSIYFFFIHVKMLYSLYIFTKSLIIENCHIYGNTKYFTFVTATFYRANKTLSINIKTAL